jgi:protein involved in polysaccharide export with SLBB domain
MGFIATHRARISNAQLCLSDTGTGAGATTAVLKVNGVAVTSAGALSVAQGAASPRVNTLVVAGSNEYPGGALINPGDVVTVDITAVPATTVPKAACVILDLTQVDV